jgi:hypothetical protein
MRLIVLGTYYMSILGRIVMRDTFNMVGRKNETDPRGNGESEITDSDALFEFRRRLQAALRQVNRRVCDLRTYTSTFVNIPIVSVEPNRYRGLGSKIKGLSRPARQIVRKRNERNPAYRNHDELWKHLTDAVNDLRRAMRSLEKLEQFRVQQDSHIRQNRNRREVVSHYRPLDEAMARFKANR